MNRLPELVAQSKDQSILAVRAERARDVRVSITGRPYVSKTARDERAEGGGMKIQDAKPGMCSQDADGARGWSARRRAPFLVDDQQDGDRMTYGADPLTRRRPRSSAFTRLVPEQETP